MPGNDEYRESVMKWANETVGEGLAAVARIAIQDVCEVVDDNTPVDTGFLVGNWQPSLGAPLIEVDDGGVGNGYAASKVTFVVSDMTLGETFFFVNNAVYARRINYGFVGQDSLGRTYNQRGVHMLERGIGYWPTAVEMAAQKVAAQ